MLRYLLGAVAGATGVLASLAGVYLAAETFWPHYLPAPAITKLEMLDEKLRFLRRRPDLDPRLLAVGSSIAWRQLDGNAFAAFGEGHFLNGGTGHLRVHQTRFMIDFYVKQFPKVSTVLMLTAVADFENCTHEPAAMFNSADASAYASGRRPAALFYLKYFVPMRYLRTARHLPGSRTPFIGENWLDGFGSSPLVVPASMQSGLRYGPQGFDTTCVEALIRMSSDLSAAGRRLVVVFAPVHPGYFRQYPGALRRTRDIVAEVQPILAAHGNRVVAMYDDPAFGGGDFWDAFHLQWPAVQVLSQRIAASIAGKGADPPAQPLDAAQRHGRLLGTATRAAAVERR